jgi:hypothetical protein
MPEAAGAGARGIATSPFDRHKNPFRNIRRRHLHRQGITAAVSLVTLGHGVEEKTSLFMHERMRFPERSALPSVKKQDCEQQKYHEKTLSSPALSATIAVNKMVVE